MFISKQTYNGLIISCKSLIGCRKFLLDEGAEYILSERFCQDILEEYFGNQRKLGMRNENPDINQFGYNANTLRIQCNVSCTSGNTRAIDTIVNILGRKYRMTLSQSVSGNPFL